MQLRIYSGSLLNEWYKSMIAIRIQNVDDCKIYVNNTLCFNFVIRGTWWRIQKGNNRSQMPPKFWYTMLFCNVTQCFKIRPTREHLSVLTLELMHINSIPLAGALGPGPPGLAEVRVPAVKDFAPCIRNVHFAHKIFPPPHLKILDTPLGLYIWMIMYLHSHSICYVHHHVINAFLIFKMMDE